MASYPVATLCMLCAFATPALADNDPEKAETNARSEYVPKIDDACGVEVSIEYDCDSLRQHNPDIKHEQTDGNYECNEPLRYMWYACQTAAGKKAVQAAGIEKIRCMGTSATVGSLTLKSGTITVERAAGESRAYQRARKRFESLVHVSLTFGRNGDEDPYQDLDWRELRYAVNTTHSTTDYCLVNGNKQEFDPGLVHRFGGKDAKLQCWKYGEKVADMEFRAGRKTGFYTQLSDAGDQVFSYKDDKLEGERKIYRKSVLDSVVMYSRGEIVWKKELYPSGKVKDYSRTLPGAYAGFRQGEDGKIYRLDCSPAVGGDPLLRALCGFEEELVVRIYDGTEKINRIETWKNGVLQKRAAGDSNYANRSNVDFAGGKKHGVERVLDRDGKLAATVTWKHGVKDGRESIYAEGGTKVVKEIVWSAGETKQVTEFWLNGNPKLKEIYPDSKRKQLRTFWDSGKLAREGDMVLCSRHGSRDWCEEGLHRSYFEHGALEAEVTFEHGQRHGSCRSWWKNGRQATQEEYVEGKRTKGMRWDQSGTLSSSDEYEADGSRKLKR